MTREDLLEIADKIEDKRKLGKILWKEFKMMHKSGRLDDEYDKFFPQQLTLPYEFMSHLAEAGYVIKKK